MEESDRCRTRYRRVDRLVQPPAAPLRHRLCHPRRLRTPILGHSHPSSSTSHHVTNPLPQPGRFKATADTRGNLLWISRAIRGSTHDTAAARIWLIPRLLAEHGLFTLGDRGY